MNKQGSTATAIIILLFLLGLGFMILKGAGLLSVVYGDSGLRTITTDARYNPENNSIDVEYTLNAAKNPSDYSQNMIMLVKINDEWESIEAITVLDGSNHVRKKNIPREELREGNNKIEFYYRTDRGHPADRYNTDCWTNNNRGNRREYNVDEDIAKWTSQLVTGTLGQDSIMVDGKQYGAKCGFYPRGGYRTGTGLEEQLYITRDLYEPGNTNITSTTLRDVIDDKVTSTTYSYQQTTINIPGSQTTTPEPPTQEQPTPEQNTETIWDKIMDFLRTVFG